jgi:hypothetical protein
MGFHLHRLWCILRFSQPFDALFRKKPVEFISSRIRLWDLPFRGFDPSSRAVRFFKRRNRLAVGYIVLL